ncbi:MAG: hypothetical protein DDT26_02478 [Dehalococcoidia bacterium]|nr:hypothetical protein [Chloroflexota bacterium]
MLQLALADEAQVHIGGGDMLWLDEIVKQNFILTRKLAFDGDAGVAKGVHRFKTRREHEWINTLAFLLSEVKQPIVSLAKNSENKQRKLLDDVAPRMSQQLVVERFSEMGRLHG